MRAVSAVAELDLVSQPEDVPWSLITVKGGWAGTVSISGPEPEKEQYDAEMDVRLRPVYILSG